MTKEFNDYIHSEQVLHKHLIIFYNLTTSSGYILEFTYIVVRWKTMNRIYFTLSVHSH